MSSKLISDLFIEVLKGLIVPIISFLGGFFYRKFLNFRRWKVIKILGQDADPKGIFNLFYAKLNLIPLYDQSGNLIRHPYIKTSSNLAPFAFSASNVISECELRAVNYLSAMFGHCDLCRPKLAHDEQKDDDISFISFGGYSNFMSVKVMNDINNILIKFSQSGSGFIFTKNNKPVMTLEDGYDYGFVLRIIPAKFPNRVWIVCAGLGEWGTSGAAWYLANKWEEFLYKNRSWYNPLNLGKIKNFAGIIKVKPPYDNSAELIGFYNSPAPKKYFGSLSYSGNAQNNLNLYPTDSTSAQSTFTFSPSADSKDEK